MPGFFFIILWFTFTSFSVAQGESMLLLKTNEGWTEIQVDSKRQLPWNSQVITSPDEIFAQASYWQQGHSLMATTGSIYFFNIPSSTRGVSVSPDKRQLVYTLAGEGLSTELIVSNFDGSEPQQLVSEGAGAIWRPDGKVSYRDGDERSGQLLYLIDPHNPDDRTVLVRGNNLQTFQWSPDFETLLYKDDNALWSIKADGTEKQALFTPDIGAELLTFAWSPNGNKIAFIHRAAHPSGKHAPWNLWTMNKDGTESKALLDLKPLSPNFLPIGAYKGVDSFQWSSDSTRLAFQAALKGDCRLQSSAGNISCRYDLYVIDAGGSNRERLTRLKLEKTGAMRWLP